MKKIFLPLFALAALAACQDAQKPAENGTVVAAAHSDGAKPAATAKPRPDSATAQKNWMAYMTPGAEHKMLASSDGTWEGEVTMWMDPAAPPQTSVMTQVNKMMLGGRYQQGIAKGSMMGMPFEGISTVGYDNHKKMYESTWMDNMGSGIMKMEGTWDATTKTINFKGKAVDPSTGDEVDERETYTILDQDNHLMTMYGPGPDGKECKVMQIHYRRKK